MDKVRCYGKEILAFILTMGLIYILKDGGITKYVVLMAVSGMFFLYGLKFFEKDFLILGIPSAVYIILGIVVSSVLGNLSYQSIKEIAFAVVPLIAAVSFFVVAQKAGVNFIHGQYWAMVLLTLSWLRYYYVEDVLETQYAFIFGVFLLYFCIVKSDLKSILFTTLMLYLMNKRITMIAAVLMLGIYGVLLWITDRKPDWKKKLPKYISIAMVVFCCAYMAFLCVADLQGQFLKDLTSGRSSAWAAVKDCYQLDILWFGRGLGDMVNLLTELQIPNFTTNIHNDLLKVFVEIGTFGYLIWLVSHFMVCYWLAKKRNLDFRKSIFLYLTIVYTLLNYATDNIMVYVNYWFPAYLLMLMTVFSEESNSYEKKDLKKEYRLLAGVIVVFAICVSGKMVKEYMEYSDPSNYIIPEDAVEMYSPDGGTTRATVWLRDGRPYYRIRSGRGDLIEASVLGIETEEGSLEKNVIFKEIKYQEILNEEDALEDVDNPIKATYQQAIITMQRDDFEADLEIRVYDRGVAFRYILPSSGNEFEELTQIRFQSGSQLRIQDGNVKNEEENLPTEELNDKVYQFPLVASFTNGRIIEISEWGAEIKNLSYAKKTERKNRTLEIEYYSKEMEDIATPWRVFEIKKDYEEK